MPLGASRRQRQNRVLAIQCLDRRFLVDAKHRCVLRRIQVQADHVSRLALEVGVIGRQIAFEPMRRSEEHTSELQSLMRNSYAVFCLKKKKKKRQLKTKNVMTRRKHHNGT